MGKTGFSRWNNRVNEINIIEEMPFLSRTTRRFVAELPVDEH